MILLIPLLLLLIPIGLQSYFGGDLLKQQKQMYYFLLSIGNVVLMIAMVFAGMLISLKGQQIKGISSLSPGFLAFGLLALFFLVVYIVVQVYRKRS
ncbi:MAG: hypothetical protein IPH84_17940 [Bacteroidales bacterium]|nr:hypothetical protein [Bacteroidales bacterium]